MQRPRRWHWPLILENRKRCTEMTMNGCVRRMAKQIDKKSKTTRPLTQVERNPSKDSRTLVAWHRPIENELLLLPETTSFDGINNKLAFDEPCYNGLQEVVQR